MDGKPESIEDLIRSLRDEIRALREQKTLEHYQPCGCCCGHHWHYTFTNVPGAASYPFTTTTWTSVSDYQIST